MRNFRELKVWQKAHKFTLGVYKCTQSFPRTELYALTSQLRRAAASIEANIAEGCGRRSDREMARFLRIAMGSATETECFLLLARDLGYLQAGECDDLESALNEAKRMIHSLLQRIESDERELRA